MDLNTLWFLLIAVLFAGFYMLEGFDFGVGILLPFLGKNEEERNRIVGSIGPFWDANEVWLITAGGAMFAAFPHWYASLFSTFYIPFVLFLLALIVRGVGMEFRGKETNPRWRRFWDWAISISCTLAAILVSVTIISFALALPINEGMNFEGNLWDLLSGKALLGGVTGLLLCLYHGALFLTLRTDGAVRERAYRLARGMGLFVVMMLALLLGTLRAGTEISLASQIVRALMLVALFASSWALRKRREGWAFGMSALAMLLFPVVALQSVFPNVMLSSLNPDWNLNIYSASSSPYTLTIMSYVALIFVPIVLAYNGWSYWVFRKRLTSTPTPKA